MDLFEANKEALAEARKVLDADASRKPVGEGT
jgi:hypothetical protein